MVPRRVLGVLVAAWVTSCLGRALPIPPPGVNPPEVEGCDPAECPNGGVRVSLTGTAQPGAVVVAEDTNPGSQGARGELLAGAARASERGDWRLVLGPQRDTAGGSVRAVQRGDVLRVYQVTLGESGGISLSVDVTVPRR
ncbi:MAG: hypothetical protein HY909_15945 [Deltaproteobacteria bacterium]|nr:hypothetical protein [Deltaproteobacteria bacterium]